MVIHEIYVGRTKEIDELFELFKKLRLEYRVYKTAKNSKNLGLIEKKVEDIWGFKAFSLGIDPNNQPNAYTYPVALSIDIDPSKYIETSSKGYKWSKNSQCAAISYITKGLLCNDAFTDEEVFAIFLHEVGHSFVHRSPMITAQQEVYKNTLIIQVLYQIFLSIISMMPLNAITALRTLIMSQNGYKLILAEFNKAIKKIPLLRELNITKDIALGMLKNTLQNLTYFVLNITGLNALSSFLAKQEYDYTTAKQIKISGHPQAYARSMERLSDDFATMYGFGPAISTALVKMESPDNQGAFMKVTHSIPVIKTIFQKQDAMATELVALMGAHPSTSDRILSILDSMENDVTKDKSLSPKIKKELKANIKKQKELIDDIKRDEPTIAKNKNEYLMILNRLGLESGNSEDFLEKKYTDPDQLRKFYKERKVRKESQLSEDELYLLSDEYIYETIQNICEGIEYYDKDAREKMNKADKSMRYDKAGKRLAGVAFRLSLKALLHGGQGKTRAEQLEYLRTTHLPALIKKCKTIDEIKYLKKDSRLGDAQFESLRRNVQAVLNNDEKRMKRLGKKFIKEVQSGELTLKMVDEHIRWNKTTYMQLLNEREKEIKSSNNESAFFEEAILEDPVLAEFLA